MLTAPIRRDIEDICTEFEPYLHGLARGRVLVTGANGFIPSYMVDTIALFNERYPREAIRMMLVNKNPVDSTSRLSHLRGNPNVVFRTADVGETFSVTYEPTVIIHAASRANPAFFKENPLDTFDANVTGTRTLLDAAARSPVRDFLFFSSSEVYGNPPAEWIPTPEEYGGNVNTLGELACYAEAKRASETLCGIYASRHGVPTKVARIFHTYGPGIRSDGKTITRIMDTALDGQPIQLSSTGLEKRAYMYVGDCARALFRILQEGKNATAYNVGDDSSYVSVRDMAALIRDKIDPTIPLEFRSEATPGEHIQDRKPSLDRLRALSFSPQTSLTKGLDNMIEHAREVRSRA